MNEFKRNWSSGEWRKMTVKRMGFSNDSKQSRNS